MHMFHLPAPSVLIFYNNLKFKDFIFFIHFLIQMHKILKLIKLNIQTSIKNKYALLLFLKLLNKLLIAQYVLREPLFFQLVLFSWNYRCAAELPQWVYRVDSCPNTSDISYWIRASYKLNCYNNLTSDYPNEQKRVYQCMQSSFLNETVEFCSVSVPIKAGNIYLKVVFNSYASNSIGIAIPFSCNSEYQYTIYISVWMMIMGICQLQV